MPQLHEMFLYLATRLAVAESLSALNALDAMGMWPAPRDAISEQGIQQLRRRWRGCNIMQTSPAEVSCESSKRSPPS